MQKCYKLDNVYKLQIEDCTVSITRVPILNELVLRCDDGMLASAAK